ncbi:hypothetical protein ACLGL1_01270 [Peptococcus simiae]|uniref:hypothetical protein n=1 Tax=Peptococcus simiae TaxID=1643805 RepID=UPI0039809B3B
MTADVIDAYARDLAIKLRPYIRQQLESKLQVLTFCEPSDDEIEAIAWEGIVDLLYDCNRTDIPSHAELRLARWLALKVLVQDASFSRARALAEEAERTTGTVQSVTALSTKVDYAVPDKKSRQLESQLRAYEAKADDIYRKLVHSLRRFPRWPRRSYD